MEESGLVFYIYIIFPPTDISPKYFLSTKVKKADNDTTASKEMLGGTSSAFTHLFLLLLHNMNNKPSFIKLMVAIGVVTYCITIDNLVLKYGLY